MANLGRRLVLISVPVALIPGLVVALGIAERSLSAGPVPRWWEGIVLLVAGGLAGLAWLGWRQFPAWSLPAIGLFLAGAFPLLGRILPAGAARILPAGWLIISIVVTFLLLWPVERDHPLPRWIWLLLACALLLQPWSIPIFSWTLFPAAIASLHLAPAHKGKAAIAAAAAVYWPIAELYDPAYAVLIWTDYSGVHLLLSLLPALIFLIIVPAALLLARSPAAQAVGLLAPVTVGLLVGEVGRSILFAGTGRGAYDAAMWLLRGGAIVQFTLLLAWVLLACRWHGQRPAPAYLAGAPVAPSADTRL